MTEQQIDSTEDVPQGQIGDTAAESTEQPAEEEATEATEPEKSEG